MLSNREETHIENDRVFKTFNYFSVIQSLFVNQILLLFTFKFNFQDEEGKETILIGKSTDDQP